MAMLRDTSCVKTLLLNVTTGKGKKKKKWSSFTVQEVFTMVIFHKAQSKESTNSRDSLGSHQQLAHVMTHFALK